MKKFVFVLGCLAFVLFLTSGVMAGIGDGVNSTAHDLSVGSYAASPADAQTRICIFCHTPHHSYKLSPANGGPGALGTGDQAPDAYDYLPLWNHALSTNIAFETYFNGPGAPTTGHQASQAIANGMTIGSASLLCLSCHDGSVAVNSYGTSSAPAGSKSTGAAFISNYNQIGKDAYLGNHHPVGFDYDAVQAVDTQIRSANVATLGTAGTVREHLYGAANSQMECGTCHAVHNKGNTGEKFLWRSDTNSRLCLTCHDKGADPGMTIP